MIRTSVYMYAIQNTEKCPLIHNEISFRMGRIRLESSSIRYFYSDQARILVICVHVNVANEDGLK